MANLSEFLSPPIQAGQFEFGEAQRQVQRSRTLEDSDVALGRGATQFSKDLTNMQGSLGASGQFFSGAAQRSQSDLLENFTNRAADISVDRNRVLEDLDFGAISSLLRFI